MSRALLSAALFVMGWLGAAPLAAHSIVYAGVAADRPIAVQFTAAAAPSVNGSAQGAKVEQGIAAEFSYSGSVTGVPANAEYRVYAPNDTQNAYQSGRADRLGRVVFVPDRPGQWRVELRTPEGHEATAELDIGADLTVPAPRHWLGWLLLASLTANLGLFVYFRERKAARAR